jgi:hypothetical protein
MFYPGNVHSEPKNTMQFRSEGTLQDPVQVVLGSNPNQVRTVGMFMIYLYIEIQMPNPSGPLAITFKPDANFIHPPYCFIFYKKLLEHKLHIF